MMRMLRLLINANSALSHWFDGMCFSESFTRDGNQDFIHSVVPSYVVSGATVYDVGGGKQPFFSQDTKISLNLFVTGIDISEDELARAPVGSYDRTVCADVASIGGRGDGDLVICQAVLEHVVDTEAAIRSISSLLKPGGLALIFVPSRNALFARLNLLLPERLKRAILFSVFPSARLAQGFPSYYNNCTPRELLKLCEFNGLALEEARYYYTSNYFSFLLPLHVVWRMWLVVFKWFCREQAAETFSLALRKL